MIIKDHRGATEAVSRVSLASVKTGNLKYGYTLTLLTCYAVAC